MSELWRRDCLYRIQVAGLALHALEPDEEIDVLEHLPGCPACRAALLEAERVLVGLGSAVEQADPPASLRGAILAQVAETVQGTGQVVDHVESDAAETSTGARAHAAASELTDAAADNAADDAAAADTPTGPPSEPQPARRPVTRRRRLRSRRAARPSASRPGLSRRSRLVVASLALLGVVAFGGLVAQSVQLAEQRDAQSAQAQTLAEIVTGFTRPGTLHAKLATSDGTALAAVVVQDGQRTLVTSGLAPNAAERSTYVVWGLGDDGPRAIGTFDVLAAGTDVRTVGPDVPSDGFTRYAISIEPGRVAPASPTSVVASGALEA